MKENDLNDEINNSYSCHTSPRKRKKSRNINKDTSPHREEDSELRKRNLINRSLNANDIDRLRQLAISRGGLIDNELRKKAWPALLGIDINDLPARPEIEVLHSHRDYNQVILDVNRSSKRFPPGMLEEVRLSYQDQLIDCIMWLLVENPELHYYQGFHDVVVTFLLVVGEELTFTIMNQLSHNHFRDFMEITMEKTNYMLNYLYPIVGKSNSKLKAFLEKSEVGTIFCLSWLITWYGHVLGDIKDIVRLYDFFIACHPLMPIYLAADIVLYRQKEILSCECEMPYVHKLLSTLPACLPFEMLILRASNLFLKYPPSTLESEAKLQHEKNLQKQRENRVRYTPSKKNSLRRNDILFKFTIYTLIGALSVAVYLVYKKNIRDWFPWLWTYCFFS